MIDYQEDAVFSVLLRIDGSIWIRAAFYALFPALLAVGIMYWEEHYPESGSITVLSALVVFRAQQAFSRFWEGTGLLHQMKGEWFDTVSNVVSFTISAKSKHPDEVMQFRGVIVRLMSLVHASALEEISTSHAQLPTIDVYGLDMNTLRYLQECVEVYGFNKVEAILHLLQSLITVGHETGLITVPPPILLRVYQTMSRGYVNLLNTKKITDTKFPFPFVQIISLLKILMTIVTPIIFASTLGHVVWAALCTFLPMFGIHSLNFVAMELENPFGIDANDLPLETFQKGLQGFVDAEAFKLFFEDYERSLGGK
mmetsp:Transcript_2096/g.4864  ORF Transcript_2096/g.4864 Transcript_2096/m.4864 type:complete len:312 (+) Transcript_2096:144-1079(+)